MQFLDLLFPACKQMYPDTARLEQVQQFRCKMLEEVFKVGIFFQLMLCPQVVLNLGRNDFPRSTGRGG